MNPRLHALFDRLGATGALLCAIHCALLPILIALLPSLGLSAAVAPSFEVGFVLFATLFGLAVLWIGILYPPLHHSVVPHAVAMTFGGTLVGLAHLANLRLNHGHVHDATCAHGH